MKIHEAVEKIWADGSLWARPLSWRGHGSAIARVSDNGNPRLMEVPCSRGGTPWQVWGPELMEEWEVLTYVAILAEYSAVQDARTKKF